MGVPSGNKGISVSYVTLLLISILSFKSGISNTIDYKGVESCRWLHRFVLVAVNNAAEISEMMGIPVGVSKQCSSWPSVCGHRYNDAVL
jgi:hypothetical protein